MNQREVEYVLSRLGCGKIKVRSNGWVASECPYAPWKHSKGRDDNPSFAVSVVPGGESRYRCLACGSSGSMANIILNIERLSHLKYGDLKSFVMQTNAPSLADISRRLQFASDPKKVPWVGEVPELGPLLQAPEAAATMLPEETLEGFSLEFPEAVGQWLLETRGLTQESIDLWELRWHLGAQRVALPVRDSQGQLVGVSGRAWPPERKPKYLHGKGFARDACLYGEHLRQEGKPALLVEGQFDSIKLHQLGYANAFCVFGSYVSARQADQLASWCPSVRVIFDGDLGGEQGTALALRAIERRLPVTAIKLSDGIDPGDFTAEKAREVLGPPT